MSIQKEIFKVIQQEIRPSNIMITENNTVKILDFGIAKVLSK